MDNKLDLMKQEIDQAKTNQAVVKSQIQNIQDEMKKKYGIATLEESKTEISKREKSLDKLESEFDSELKELEEKFPWE